MSPSVFYDQYLPTLRADGHSVKAYLSVMTGGIVARGVIRIANSTPSAAVLNLGLLTIDWTMTSGDYSKIRPGMRIVVTQNVNGTDTGLIKGVTNVRSFGTISNLTLPVREWEDPYLKASLDDFVTVYEDILLGDKLVGATEQFNPDHRYYVDENNTQLPVPNSGGWYAGFIDPMTGVARVNFTGANSFTLEGYSPPDHYWACDGATFVVGSATSEVITLTFDEPGYYAVYHTLTDPDSGNMRTALVPVRIHEKGVDDPYEITLDGLSGTIEQGWQASVTTYANSTLAQIPDGAPVILWVEQQVAGLPYRLGGIHDSTRVHILMVGYLRRDTSEVSLETQTVTFDVINPMQMMKEMPGFSKVMLYSDSPDGWSTFLTLTVFRAITQIVVFYTYFIEAGFDFNFSNMVDYAYPALFLQKQTPLDQMNELALSVDAQIVTDRMGRMIHSRRRELMKVTERTTDIHWLTIGPDDINVESGRGIEISRDHMRTLDTLQVEGVSSGLSNNNPLFSRYPGTPGRGTDVTTVDRIICASQADLNTRAGHYGAFYDRIYHGTDGIIEHAPSVTLSLRGGYWMMLDLLGGLVSIDIPAEDNPRGVRLDEHPFIVDGMAIDISEGVVTTRLQLRGDTFSSAPGSTYYPPVWTGVFDPGIEIYYPSPDYNSFYLPAGTIRMAGITEYGLVRSTNFGSGDATYWDYMTWDELLGDSDIFRVENGVPDAFSYSTGAIKAWIGAAGTPWKIYYIDVGSRTAVLKHTFTGEDYSWPLAQTMGMDASFGRRNHVVASLTQSDKFLTAYTTTNTSFTEVTVNSHYDYMLETPTNVLKFNSVFISPRVAGKVLLSAFTETADKPDFGGYKSSNYGSSYSSGTTPTIVGATTLARGLHVPYDPARNINETTLYYASRPTDNSAARLWRSGPSGVVDISPFAGAVSVPVHRNGMSTAVTNMNRLLVAAESAGVWLTDNANASSPSWTELPTYIPPYYTGFTNVAIAGDNANVFYFWGNQFYDFSNNLIPPIGAPSVAMSVDGGQTVVDQMGNMADFSCGAIKILLGW